MDAFGGLQSLLTLIIGVLALGVQGFALLDAVRQRSDAFPAAGKLTKPLWLSILAVATAIGVIFVRAPFSIFMVVAFVAAAVYLVDVRPAIQAISGKGGNNGPYGPW